MSLQRLILDALKDPDLRRRARARPAAAAQHYRIPEHRLADYLKFIPEN